MPPKPKLSPEQQYASKLLQSLLVHPVTSRSLGATLGLAGTTLTNAKNGMRGAGRGVIQRLIREYPQHRDGLNGLVSWEQAQQNQPRPTELEPFRGPPRRLTRAEEAESLLVAREDCTEAMEAFVHLDKPASRADAEWAAGRALIQFRPGETVNRDWWLARIRHWYGVRAQELAVLESAIPRAPQGD